MTGIFTHTGQWPAGRVGQRIISLVPSITELLFYLGLEEQVVGITRFCVHPQAWYRTKPRVGGTKDPRVAAILALQPDLVIASREENVQAHIEELARHVPVWLTEVDTVPEAMRMITAIGLVTGREKKAAALHEELANSWERIKGLLPPYRVAYFIWRRPYMLAGGDTYIHSVLQHAGLTNVAAHLPRYPVVNEELLQQLAPEVVLLSSEPYPFAARHIQELQTLLPQSRIVLADGETWSWYGSRMLQVPAYLRQLQATLAGTAGI